jgi:hypothetical protein
MIIITPTRNAGNRRHHHAAKRDQPGEQIDDAERDDPTPFGA